MTKQSRLQSITRQEPDWPRRIALAVVAVIALVLTYALGYQWVMMEFEGRQSVPYLQALQVVVESLTTAGFGGHAPWESTQGNLYILLMNLSGVLLVFLAIPLFLTPMIREVFQEKPPRSSDLEDHIIVCGYSEKDEVVREELEHFAEQKHVDIPFLYVEPDAETARQLLKRGVAAMVGAPDTVETLRAANAAEAEALVADVDDETNPSVILAAKMIDDDLPVLSVVRDRSVANHHEYAGADRVIRARDSFGKSLAIRASGSYAQKFRNAVEIDDGVEVTELVVEDGSELVGQTLSEAALYDCDGRRANVIAAWVGGKFLISPNPQTPIRKNAILVVSGDIDDVDISGVHPIPGTKESASRVVIGGFGTVGKTVWTELNKVGVETTVVDKNKSKGDEVFDPESSADDPHDRLLEDNPIDIVGDLTDETTIQRTRLDEADAVVVSLNRDIPTIYATILLEHVAPDVEIIARADEPESISTLYQAGADFVLSLTTVTGEIVASELLDILGEQGGFLPASTEFEFTRIDGRIFAGHRLMEIDLRNVTGCTVVAVERGNELSTDVRGDFVVQQCDTLIIAGSAHAIEKFNNRFVPAWIDEYDIEPADAETEQSGPDEDDEETGDEAVDDKPGDQADDNDDTGGKPDEEALDEEAPDGDDTEEGQSEETEASSRSD